MAATVDGAPSIDGELFSAVQKRNVDRVKQLLREKTVKINCLDEHGMTPLQHAAYKGDKELCEILLDHGADVNCNQHDHGYTTLMFAALSGNVPVTSLLLQAGASVNAVNSVGRTAAQMAAFVGNSACVSVINTFIHREQIDYYTKPQGLETEAKLPSHVASLLHRFVTRLNVNPVGMVLFIQQHISLLENADKIHRVLEVMSEKEMKKKETNEVIAFKLHLLAYVIEYCGKMRNKSEDDQQMLKLILKTWLKGNSADDFPKNLELFVRQAIRQFPYSESTILQQLVRNLAPVKVGDEPTAISLVNSSINGQRMATNEDTCFTCGEVDSTVKTCSSCKKVRYCSQRCQKLHWFTHKQNCTQISCNN